MRNLSNIEANTILLMQDLEQYISAGSTLPTHIILQMDAVKKSINDEDRLFGKDLELLYKQVTQNIKN